MNQEQIDSFIAADAELLGGIEDEILSQLSELVDNTASRMEALPEDATADEMEAPLVALNDALSAAIANTMFLHQRDVAEQALTLAPGRIPECAAQRS